METLATPYTVEDLIAEDPNLNGPLVGGEIDAGYFDQGVGESVSYPTNELSGNN